ncbi:GNAT family N-acetyltransferase [Actinacidiphila paucisporea]|uniref:Acetyltransferase (GNAT) family protein n=1 Tax=Actinacidiphila paucisporea TaxID=310782 RepID=A0A1M7JA63_9ACTN|nr:GNAT family N-acetyltransferase [Actinacidiphila paucisporea]SHM49896.1 Acetyltransferase (GNAT) family protein [Actinacidiphila paucisporea]
MTTTLRPAGPERREQDGARSRQFTVCVNGRPVGSVRIGADPRGGPGRIDALAIDEPDRRRGRGAVAALAAEEVLRQWGCTRVLVSVPDGAPYALRLAAALGYTETNRTLHKDLPADTAPSAPPAAASHDLPPGSVLRELTLQDSADWLARQRAGFVAALTAAGVPAEQAEAHAAASYALAFPGGTPAPGSALLALDHDGTTVGRLWLHTAPGPGWVQAVEVTASHRGRGHGRTLMLAAESACRAAGTTALALNVFTANEVAIRLYTSLGYRTTLRQLWKPLG